MFHKCLEFGISLNPKKCIFGVPQGKLIGHVVSKEGVSINLDQIKALKELPLLVNKKGVQSFLGKVNFVSCFISNFAGMVRPITMMLKKKTHFKWTLKAKEAFENIKYAIYSAPVLSNSDMSKDFIMYVFSRHYSIVVVLTQKDVEKGSEHPIAIHSKTLKEYEAKYNFVEKKTLAIVKGLTKFRNFITYNNTTVYVAHPSVREYIMEGDITEKRENWITNILEYDIDVRPTKIICSKGLYKYIAQEFEPRETKMAIEEVMMVTFEPSKTCWMEAQKHFMKMRSFPKGLPPEKKRFYRLQNIGFHLVDGVLFKRNFDGILPTA